MQSLYTMYFQVNKYPKSQKTRSVISGARFTNSHLTQLVSQKEHTTRWKVIAEDANGREVSSRLHSMWRHWETPKGIPCEKNTNKIYVHALMTNSWQFSDSRQTWSSLTRPVYAIYIRYRSWFDTKKLKDKTVNALPSCTHELYTKNRVYKSTHVVVRILCVKNAMQVYDVQTLCNYRLSGLHKSHNIVINFRVTCQGQTLHYSGLWAKNRQNLWRHAAQFCGKKG